MLSVDNFKQLKALVDKLGQRGAAKATGLPRSTIQSWLKSGKVPEKRAEAVQKGYTEKITASKLQDKAAAWKPSFRKRAENYFQTNPFEATYKGMWGKQKDSPYSGGDKPFFREDMHQSFLFNCERKIENMEFRVMIGDLTAKEGAEYIHHWQEMIRLKELQYNQVPHSTQFYAYRQKISAHYQKVKQFIGDDEDDKFNDIRYGS